MTEPNRPERTRLSIRILQGASLFVIGTAFNTTIRAPHIWSGDWRMLTLGFLAIAAYGGLSGTIYFYLEPLGERGEDWRSFSKIGAVVLPAVLAFAAFMTWAAFVGS